MSAVQYSVESSKISLREKVKAFEKQKQQTHTRSPAAPLAPSGPSNSVVRALAAPEIKAKADEGSSELFGIPPPEITHSWRKSREALIPSDWFGVVSLLSHYDFFVAFGMSFYKSCRSLSLLDIGLDDDAVEDHQTHTNWNDPNRKHEAAVVLNRYKCSLEIKGMIGAMPPGWKFLRGSSDFGGAQKSKFAVMKPLPLPRGITERTWSVTGTQRSKLRLTSTASCGRIEFLEGICQGGQWDLYFASASLLGIQETDLWQGWINLLLIGEEASMLWPGDSIDESTKKTPLEYAAEQGKYHVLDYLLATAEPLIPAPDQVPTSWTHYGTIKEYNEVKARAAILANNRGHLECALLLDPADDNTEVKQTHLSSYVA